MVIRVGSKVSNWYWCFVGYEVGREHGMICLMKQSVQTICRSDSLVFHTYPIALIIQWCSTSLSLSSHIIGSYPILNNRSLTSHSFDSSLYHCFDVNTPFDTIAQR
jgi:hypothetical protein